MRAVLLVQLRRGLRRGVARAEASVGGPARLRVIALLASVLALTTADGATFGSVASKLEPALHISNTDIGLPVAVTTDGGAGRRRPLDEAAALDEEQQRGRTRQSLLVRDEQTNFSRRPAPGIAR
jgi:hypothetical protein